MRTEQEFYAQKYKNGGSFHNFYPSLMQMSVCGPGPYYHVKVIADPNGDYYAWHNFEHDEFRHTNQYEAMVRICFPYDIRGHEKRGEGKLIRVRVENLGEATR